MTPRQAFVLEKQVERLRLSDGQIMDIACAVSHNGALISLAHLSEADSELLILELQMIEQKTAVGA